MRISRSVGVVVTAFVRGESFVVVVAMVPSFPNSMHERVWYRSNGAVDAPLKRYHKRLEP
jgi:hypothetical protein